MDLQIQVQTTKLLEMVEAELAVVINILIQLGLEMYPLQVPHKEIPQDQEMVLGEHLVAAAQAARAQVRAVMLIVAPVAQAELEHQVQLQAHLFAVQAAAEAELLWPVVAVDPLHVVAEQAEVIQAV